VNPYKVIALVIAIAVIVVVAVRLTKPPSQLAGGRPGTASSYGNAPRNLPADAVLAIAPGTGAPANHRPVSVLSPVLTEFSHAKSYKALYDRLRPASSRTPEETWILAKIFQECGKQTGHDRRDDSRYTISEDVAVERFAAALPSRDPSRERRIAAYRGVVSGHCRDLRDLDVTPQAIRELLAQAASAGDPKASADLVRHDLWAPIDKMDPTKLSMATAPWPAISTAQVEQLKGAAESGDPYALITVAETLAGPFTNMSLEATQDGRTVNSGDLQAAAHLVACDAGYPCGPDSRSMQFGCAYLGNCDAQTFREYEFFYGLTPDSSQRVAQYQAMLEHAVRDHDWSGFTFHPGPAVLLAPYVKP
jgi:hypothetical protein